MEPSAGAPGNPEALLRTDRLTRVTAGRRIVDAISVEIRAGDVLAVVGPSGSGKSSFLRLLNRLDEPTDGSVYLDGRDYRDLAPRDLRRRVGMVMQTPVLFPGTIADNVRYGPAQRGETVSDDSVAGILDLVGLPDFAERPVDHLSGGEAQRVAVARALANAPDILLLDEPTSALDETAKRGIEALMTQVVRARSLTCVVVTHDLAQAARLARRVLVIEAGRLKRIGPLEEVLGAADMD